MNPRGNTIKVCHHLLPDEGELFLLSLLIWMQQKVLSGTVVLKLERASESLGKFVQTQFLDPPPQNV